LTCCGLLATPSTRRVRHGGVSIPFAVNRMILIAAAHTGEIEVLDSHRFGGA
jgi:hypothetical protein